MSVTAAMVSKFSSVFGPAKYPYLDANGNLQFSTTWRGITMEALDSYDSAVSKRGQGESKFNFYEMLLVVQLWEMLYSDPNSSLQVTTNIIYGGGEINLLNGTNNPGGTAA